MAVICPGCGCSVSLYGNAEQVLAAAHQHVSGKGLV
jgi:hypothetical protein